RNKPLAAELGARLFERHVGWRQDQVRSDQLILAHGPTFAANEVQHAPERRLELLLVRRPAHSDHLIVELAELRPRLFWKLVLSLGRYPDDHGACCSCCGDCFCSTPPPEPAPSSPADPAPSSAFIFWSSESTSLEEDSSLSWRSMSSSPWPSAVRSSNVPAASSSPTAPARAFMFSVLSTARCIASPTSAICSPTPVAASEIRTCASAALYWALMTSFLVRKASTFERSCCSESISFCCCDSSSVIC